MSDDTTPKYEYRVVCADGTWVFDYVFDTLAEAREEVEWTFAKHCAPHRIQYRVLHTGWWHDLEEIVLGE